MDDKDEKTPDTLPIINGSEDVQKALHATGGLTLWMTVLLLVGEMAGTGVLALPKALADTGWIGVLLIIGGSIVGGFNGVHLGHCWNIVTERYPEYRDCVKDPYACIAEKAVGKWMRYVVTISLYLTLFGACTLFLILIAENTHSILQYFGVTALSFCVLMVIVAALLIPLSLFGSPKDFWLLAVFAAATSITGTLLMLVGFGLELSKPGDTPPNTVDFNSFFLAFGAIMFAYGGASTFPTIQHDMRKPEKFPIAAAVTFFILLCLYIPPAVMGFITYGSELNANAVLTLPEGSLKITIEMLFTAHVFFAFVIAMNPFVQDAERIFNVPHNFNWKRVVLRTAIVCLTLFTAETIPHFGALLSLIGGSTITLLTFVAPSLFYLCLCRQQGDWPKRQISLHGKVAHVEIIVIGVLGGIASTYSAIFEIASPDTFVPPCYVNATAAAK